MKHLDQPRAVQFTSLARNLLLAGGLNSDAIANAESCKRTSTAVVDVLRAAVVAGTLANPSWGGALSDFRLMSEGFIESLRNLSVLDRLLDGGAVRVPLNVAIGVVTSTSEGTEVAEGQPSPVTRLALAGPTLQPRKVTAIIAITRELLDSMVRGGEALLAREMRTAVARATNSAFLFGVTSGAPTFPSAGSTSTQVLADIETLLDSVKPTATSRLFLVVDGITAAKLATKAGTDGHLAFPAMTPQGGEIAGIPVLVADDVTENTDGHSMVLIDAAAVAAASDIVSLDVSQQTMLQLNDAPVGTAAAVWTSLWQSNLAALKALRWFGFELLRPDGVAVVENVDY